MEVGSLDNALWAAGFLGHVALLLILVGRARWREFPVFTSLIAFQVLETVILFLAFRYASGHVYFRAYWILACGDYCFQVALIIEIARIVLRPIGTWVQEARRVFMAWSAVGTLAAVALCLTIVPPATSGMNPWEMRADIFTSVLTCELFLSMSLAANRLRLLWRGHVMALGQGLTVWAIFSFGGDVAYVLTGSRHVMEASDRIRMYIYLGALAFWIVSFWFPKREFSPSDAEIRERLGVLRERTGYSSRQQGPRLR